ncbi:MAG: holo-ACP synthase [Myxococcota bacterium]|nr:holo-ACP synthase [Myxococcota bacterium]
MILGLGIDVCPIDRIEQVLGRHGDIFSRRVFTDSEQAHAGDGRARAERLAARWAAKEASIKALGGPSGLRWRDMEVVNAPSGAPALLFHGQAAERAQEMGVVRRFLSLSHAGGVAVAVVILEGKSDVG